VTGHEVLLRCGAVAREPSSARHLIPGRRPGSALRRASRASRAGRGIVTAKPTVETLGIDVAAQSWQRSGDGDGSIEIAFVRDAVRAGGDWVLMRVAGDPGRPGVVYDRHEWVCFLDGRAERRIRRRSRLAAPRPRCADRISRAATCNPACGLVRKGRAVAAKPSCEPVIRAIRNH